MGCCCSSDTNNDSNDQGNISAVQPPININDGFKHSTQHVEMQPEPQFKPQNPIENNSDNGRISRDYGWASNITHNEQSNDPGAGTSTTDRY